VRVDFLDFTSGDEPSFLILLDTFPGGDGPTLGSIKLEPRWETIIQVAGAEAHLNRSPSRYISSTYDHEISAKVDHALDTVVVSLPLQLAEPPGPFAVRLISFSDSDSDPLDSLGPINSDRVRPQPLPVSFAFWNTLPASTPAQALRNWDGAHAGPAGERFGLRYLLEAVETNNVPVTLTDLKRLESLVALDTLNVLSQIQALESNNLVSLPDIAPAIVCDQAQTFGLPKAADDYLDWLSSSYDLRSAAALACPSQNPSFSLESNGSLYPTTLSFPLGGKHTQVQDHLSSGTYLIPASVSLGEDGGPSLVLREQLVGALHQSASASPFFLAADFQAGFWGTPGEADDTFRWIAAHPWIRPISLETYQRAQQHDYLNALDSPDRSTSHRSDPLLAIGLRLIEASHSRSVHTLVWDLLEDLDICQLPSANVMECQRQTDRATHGLRLLSAVVLWEQSLDPQRAKSFALESRDWTDLVLFQDESWFVLGRHMPTDIQALFHADNEQGIYPIVWDLEQPEQVESSSIDLQFESKAGELKLDILPENDQRALQLPVYLPSLMLEPRHRCTITHPSSQESQLECGGRIVWSLHSSRSNLEINSFLDAANLGMPVEDPNQDYPSGHYLPIPYAEIQLRLHGPTSLTLRSSP
jgi:hypothetical protein